MTSNLDEISALLGSIETIHCPDGHSHTDEKPFQLLVRAWLVHTVNDVFGRDVTPESNDVYEYNDALADDPNDAVLACGTCGKRFPLPEKGQIVWP